MRSMNPTYRKMGPWFTVASLTISSTAARLRSLQPIARQPFTYVAQPTIGLLHVDFGGLDQQHLDAGFITLDHRAFQQPVTH
jgi:hypothetical protein